MTRLSTTLTALLAALAVSVPAAEKPSQPWPLKGTIDLSSGYGDLRANRFHAGLDLRTGGLVGVKVYSPVDGYVWRVRMSYRGYGKGLYVKGEDDCLYVFGHLNGFASAIESAVQRSQFREQRYYVDLYFPKDSIPVKKGELIALSGQTGVGAPHLHFEKRSPDNVPLNPLTHGFELDDKTPPTFERVGFLSRGVYPLTQEGEREKYIPVRKAADNRCAFDEVPYIDEVFGVVADCYDQMRAGGMRQTPYAMTMKIDGREVYRLVFDSLPYEIGPYAGLICDQDQLAAGRKRAVRLFQQLGDRRDPAAPVDWRSGLVGEDSTFSVGTHELEIVAEDVAGNVSTLSGRFMWGHAVRPDDPYLYGYELRNVDGDSVWPEGYFFDYGAYIPTESELVYGVKDPRGEFWIGIPPSLIEQNLAKFHILKNESVHFLRYLRDRNVWAYDYTSSVHNLLPDGIGLGIDKGTFFTDRFLLVEPLESPVVKTSGLISKTYNILPETFPLRKSFTVSIQLDSADARSAKAGLCWYDREKNEWMWIDTTPTEPYVAAGPSLGGGMFAALIDDVPPTIRTINLRQGLTYTNLQPTVECDIDDNLSGFEDDRSFDIRINGVWMLPQYDFETGKMVATLEKPLAPGKAVLTMWAVDRAGNKTERKVEFVVEKGSKKKKN